MTGALAGMLRSHKTKKLQRKRFTAALRQTSRISCERSQCAHFFDTA
jgi:hypothetical protein